MSLDPEAKKRYKDKADKLDKAFKKEKREHPNDPVVRQTSAGEVRIEKTELIEDEHGVPTLNVWVDSAQAEPQFQLINPPSLVPSAMGDVVIGNQRYREDPLQAIAEVVAPHGGTTSRYPTRTTTGRML